ncbi:MAG: tyrosine-protein phosphatase [Cyanobacteria bacterium REEB67]|nr:tyrosine-protein phosphatase [Cyanobacteria bacterium REEB67]
MTSPKREKLSNPIPPIPPDSLTSRDLPHYYVVDERLHRGGQPNEKGFAWLKSQGIRTVINLREETGLSFSEAELMKHLELNYVAIDIDPFLPPADEKIERFLLTLKESDNHPAFVHCLHGQDRTGMMVGIYRMVIHGHEYEKVFDEMLELGFHREFVNLEKTARRWEGRKL